MRRTTIGLLLVSLAAPAMAQSWHDRDGNQPDRQEIRHDRREVGDDRREVRQDQREVRGDFRRGDFGEARRDQREAREDRRDMRGDRRDLQNDRGRFLSNGGSGAHRWEGRGAWNNGWRQDRRYDWQGYRSANRGAYRLPRYFAPRGYSYHRYSVGYRLNPFLYSQRYWIADPWAYRLPQAYGTYRWVRYYDDALLIDVRSGRVVDVINGIFW